MVTIDGKGRVTIQLANFSAKDVYLNPRIPAAPVTPFALESTIREPGSGDIVMHNSAVNGILSRMYVCDLKEPQQECLQVIERYQDIIS